MCQRPEPIAARPGRTPIPTAAAVSKPSGWRQPKEPARTSSWKAAAMHAAERASPTATGASSTPGSGRRIFSPRSLSTASQPKTMTRPADRIAHVSRQLRATSGATSTGRYKAMARTPNCPLPNPNRARRATPRALAPIEPAGDPSATGAGTPAIRSQPCRPNSEEAHGRLARNARTEAATAIDTSINAARADPPARSDDRARTTPIATTSRANDGTKAKVTPVSNASWHSNRSRARAGTAT